MIMPSMHTEHGVSVNFFFDVSGVRVGSVRLINDCLDLSIDAMDTE